MLRVCRKSIDYILLVQYTLGMQSKSLKEISEIIAGYTFREALKSDFNGDIRVLLAKNIHDDGTIHYHELTKVALTISRANSFVMRKDVILSSRGVFRAGVFDKDTKDTIAASSVFILRLKDDKVLPEYVSIYLNSEAGQSSIKKVLTGSTIKTILRGALEDISIPIPSLNIQKLIVSIADNWQQREKLLIRKIHLSKQIADRAINHLLTK